MDKEELIKENVICHLRRNILISPNLLNAALDGKILMPGDIGLPKVMAVLTEEGYKALHNKNIREINWLEFERSQVFHEKNKQAKQHGIFVDYINQQNNTCMGQQQKPDSHHVKIISTYSETPKPRVIQDFVSLFRQRYCSLESYLKNRAEMGNLVSIARISSKTDKEKVAFIGMVVDIKKTKNSNVMLVMEDLTGTTRVLINKNKPALFKLVAEVVCDEVIGVVGAAGGNVVFANTIIFPDVPVTKELKKCSDECYAAFISDVHVGSKYFLSTEFNKFLSWINGSLGSEQQKYVAKKIKYIFIVGDLIDGVGIYPGQDDELELTDVKMQYEECARLLSKIPKDKQIILCPGNHDAVRVAEPQPALYKDYAEALYGLPNAQVVSNPAMVNIHSSDGFSGFDVLLYHGYSFDHYINGVDALRLGGGYSRGDLMMKFLLKKRHLAPTHMSTAYIPDSEKDPLVIEKVPDFFVTGHIHYAVASNYRNVSLICCSCWQSKTSFQEKLGHEPQPARVPIVNLSTREIKMLKFGG